MKSRYGLILVLGAFLVLSYLVTVAIKNVRFDLTESGLYTLSPETRNVLNKLEKAETLTLYFSEKATKDLPALRTYAKRVQELLEEYVALSNGKLSLTVVDPEPFSEAEDLATAAGLQGVPAGARGDEIYFGLVARNEQDKEEVIPFFQPDKEKFLEYDLSKLIFNLNRDSVPKVGILSGLNMNGGYDFMTQSRQPAWMVVQQIEDLYQVEWLPDAMEEVETDISILLLVHPKNLPQQTLMAIDQYVLQGGKVIAFVDPLAESEQSSMQGADDKRSDLDVLLQKWGVVLEPGKVVGDYANSLVVGMGGGRGPVRHIGLLGLKSEVGSFNADEVILAGLESINMSSAGILKPAEGATTNFTRMIESSSEAAPLDSALWATLQNPEALMNGFTPTGEPYTLAARVTGKAQTAFPEGVEISEEVTPETSADTSKDETSQTKEPQMRTRKILPKRLEGDSINVVVVADTDVLTDRLWVQVQEFFGQRIASPWADNSGLLVNALDNLSGNADLINIRSRGKFSRPFTRVEDLRRDAEEHFRTQQQSLEAQLKETEAKLVELEKIRGDADKSVLSKAQVEELDKFQSEKLKIRKELRDVQHQLDQDIEALGTDIKLINIVLLPLLLTFGMVLFRFIRKSA
ncbi:MAG: Gldg family protein [Hahellaceae bacterium]|nr:Gldg family protein [Hahellaceae bacterium]